MWIELDGDGPLFRQLYRALRDRDRRRRRAARHPPAGDARARDRARRLAHDGAARVRAARRRGLSRRPARLGKLRAGRADVAGAPRQAASRPRSTRRTPAPPRLSPFGTFLTDRRSRPIFSSYVSGRPRLPYDFRYGAPSLHDFPVQIWQRCLGRPGAARVGGLLRLRPSAGLTGAARRARRLSAARARRAAASPSSIQIVSGSQQGLDLAARLLLTPGDMAVVEEPGYEGRAARLPRRRRASGARADRRRRSRRRRARTRRPARPPGARHAVAPVSARRRHAVSPARRACSRGRRARAPTSSRTTTTASTASAAGRSTR